MDLIIFLVIGGVIGWVGSLVMGTNAQMGLVANILVGIVGSGLGGWLAPKLGISAGSGVLHYAVAVGGAVLLIVILKMLKILK